MINLLTDGAGYIGNHTFIELREASLQPVILEGFPNSHPAALMRLEAIIRRLVSLGRRDALESACVKDVLQRHPSTGDVHFAGDKGLGRVQFGWLI